MMRLGAALALASITLSPPGLAFAASGDGDPAGGGKTATPEAAAEAFRTMFGLQPAANALASAPVSSTARAKWGVDLTSAEEADLDARAVLQEKLGEVEAIVAANPTRLGGSWLDQRASGGHGFIVMIAFVESVDGDLMTEIQAAAPTGTVIQPVIVERSMTMLQSLMDKAHVVGETSPNVTGVSLAPQDNAVVIRTADGTTPAALVGISGYQVIADVLTPVGCTSSVRCCLRPYRGGMEIQDQYKKDNGADGWYECTSAFMVRRSNGSLSLLTAAHCQQDYVDVNVWTLTGSGFLEPLGAWGADTVPSRSIFCLTVCDMDVEIQVINGPLTSVPTNKNIILYSDSDRSHAITGYRTYGSSWVGASVCSVGIKSNVSCGTISSVGSGNINMRKESFIARVNKGAYANLAGVIQGGDSGGPVVNGGTAYGTMTAVTSNYLLFFSAVSPALSPLSVTLCTTASC